MPLIESEKPGNNPGYRSVKQTITKHLKSFAWLHSLR